MTKLPDAHDGLNANATGVGHDRPLTTKQKAFHLLVDSYM
jgi:hypothetical protein